MNNLERRYIRPMGLELREANEDEGTGPMLVGYSVVFDSDSEDMGFIEQMDAASITEEVLTESDIRGLYNHIPSNLLGRSPAGEIDGETMRLKVDDRGLYFEIDLPDTTVGRDVAELVRRGDLTGNSFAFTVAEDEWDYESDPPRRRVTRVGELFDIGPVTYPAYPETVVSGRALELAKGPPAEKRDHELEIREREHRLRELEDPNLLRTGTE
ncbi:MAG: HK97 family phage prohead protease [Gemmatimonadota bacterium]